MRKKTRLLEKKNLPDEEKETGWEIIEIKYIIRLLTPAHKIEAGIRVIV